MLNIVEEYLKKNKWVFEEIDRGKTIGLSLEIPFIDVEPPITLPVYYFITEDMSNLPTLRITAVPILTELETTPDISFYLKLLTTNHNLTYSKVSIDGDGEIELILDLKDVTVGSLEWAMEELFNSAYAVYDRFKLIARKK